MQDCSAKGVFRIIMNHLRLKLLNSQKLPKVVVLGWKSLAMIDNDTEGPYQPVLLASSCSVQSNLEPAMLPKL
jgi:hypothetical protein